MPPTEERRLKSADLRDKGDEKINVWSLSETPCVSVNLTHQVLQSAT